VASRRARALAALALSIGLSACGFQLRGAATFPFDTIFVNAPTSPPLAQELNRALTFATNA
jgi:LPS-assembly lipoprotein